MKTNQSVSKWMCTFFLCVFSLCISGCGKEKQEEGSKLNPPSNAVISSIITEEGQKIEKVDPGYFTIEMQLTASSKDGKEFKGVIANSKDNLYQVYTSIILPDSEEELFRSPLIPVGSQIEQFTLERKLESGSYNCILIFHNIDEDGETEISTVNVAYTLVVQ